jgi:hypothetical protein
MVKVHHTNEFLESLDSGGLGELSDGSYCGGKWCNTVLSDVVAKEVQFLSAKLAFGQIDNETMLL